MIDKNAFDNLVENVNKYQIHLRNYQIPSSRDEIESNNGTEEKEDDLVVYGDPNVVIPQPQLSIWAYLKRYEVEELLDLKKSSHIRIFIDSMLKKSTPRGLPRLIFRELIYTVTKFCKSLKFNLEQTGAVLSQFYLTHRYFTSSLNIGPEKLYLYFKELQMDHSLPFPPKRTQLFNLNEVKAVMLYFCKIYLKNLPLIRCLSLPNFALCANYKLEPEMKKGKKKKGKHDKKNKKDKKKHKKK